ncbi:hybrid sensor histidine kinase/response regulator [Desulforhopalus sp. 52FAK]
MVNFSRSELLELFLEEVKSYIPEMENGLSAVLASKDIDAVGELHRLFHNVKGAAAQVQLSHLSDGSRVVEEYLSAIVEGEAPLLDAGVESIKKAIELLTVFVEMESSDTVVEKKFCEAIEAMAWPLGEEGDVDAGGALDTIRSLLPLLNELVVCLEDDATHREQNRAVYNRLASAFSTLTHLTRSSRLEVQSLLFDEFHSLLTSLAEGGHPQQDEVAGLVKDFLGFVEVAFSENLKDRSESLEKIHKQLAQVKLLFISGAGDSLDALQEKEPDFPADDLFGDEDNIDDSLSFLDELSDMDVSPATEINETNEAREAGEELDDDPDFGADEAVLDFFEDNETDEEDEEDEECVEASDTAAIEPLEDSADVADFFTETEDVEDSYESEPIAYTDPEQDALAEIFKEECEEHFITINASLHDLEQQVALDSSDRAGITPSLREIRRAVHTLKGAASITGVNVLAGAAHVLEDMLDWLYDNEKPVGNKEIQLLGSSVETLERLAADPDTKQADLLQANVTDYLSEQKSLETEIDDLETADDKKDDVVQVAPELEQNIPERSILPEDSGTLRVRLDDLDELLSVEGELVVARGAIEKMVDEFTATLTDLENVKENLRRKSQELESGFEVQALYGGQATAAKSVAPLMLVDDQGGQDLAEFDPIELDRYSELNLIIRSLNEISVDVSSIYSTLLSLTGDLGGQVSKQQLTMRQMQDKLMRIRMTPLSSISRVLYSTVRSASAKLEKTVDFNIVGEDVYMDRFVWARVTDPLVHILRNSVDHGIEEAEVRLRAGKGERGRITLRAEQRSRYVVLHIEDDGAGIDPKRLRAKLSESGIGENLDSLSDSEVLEYIFFPSVSTKEDVSELSGRGVGLDVVRKNIQELRGSVHIDNSPGEGLRFEIHIPFTLSVNRAVLVDVAGSMFAIPLQDVEEIRQFKAEDVQLVDGKSSLHIQGEDIAFGSLASYVQLEEDAHTSGGAAVLFSTTSKSGEDAERLILSVGEIVEQREIIVKSLGSHLARVRGVSGVTVSGSGDLIPILNLRELVDVAQPVVQMAVETDKPSAQQAPLKVLIVDDSISVRYSVARLVESCGWVQKQAVDGLDALTQLESYTPDVIILDIEMPKMNGYEFKSNINNREAYKDIPVVMLTSRASEKHQQKARELGVDYYLTKPYEEDSFVQLLEKIEEQRS